MDLSLFLGALSVVLTVLFFVIGYRQTIGARRERARAASGSLVDTLFRRLALEEEFSLSRSDVTKIISGWALNARVRPTDIHSLREVEELLLARVLESDYISHNQRRTIAARISAIFAEEKNPVFLGKREPDPARGRVEWLLAAGSAVAAAVTAGITALLTDNQLSNEASTSLIESAILPSLALIILTTGALLLYTRARDISRPGTDEPRAFRSLEYDLERTFYVVARRRNQSLRPSSNPVFDFVYDEGGGLVGVEVKQDINKISGASLRRLLGRVREAIANGFVLRAVIVSAAPPAQRVRSLQDDQVRIVHISDFLRELPVTREPHEDG